MNSRVMKTEPEDLSVREERGMVRLPGNRQINLEAGAQAIQVLIIIHKILIIKMSMHLKRTVYIH